MKLALVLLPNWRRETPSLAIAYLASNLTKAGHTVDRFEFNLRFNNSQWLRYMESMNQDSGFILNILKDPSTLDHRKYSKLNDYVKYCSKQILKKKSEAVAFSVYSGCNCNLSLAVAMKIKESNPTTKIVFGGPGTSVENQPENYLKIGLVDFLVLGEGDQILPRLIQNLSHPEKVKGIGYLRKGRFFHSNWTPADVNSLEFPLFEKEDIENSEVPWMLPIIATRGCSGTCDFCFERKFWMSLGSI